MKKHIIYALSAASILSLSSCGELFKGKPSTAVAPEPDTELSSTKEVVFATQVISDIEMIASFLGDDDRTPDFYLEEPGYISPIGPIQVNGIPSDDFINIAFRKNQCLDGHLREGTVLLNFTNPNPNARYYRSYEFVGKITLSEYKVDGWLVKVKDGVPCMVYNKVSKFDFDPSKEKLTWIIDGSFEFVHPTDPSKNMTWTGKLTKTLVNTSDPLVFNPSRAQAIQWKNAIVEYTGEVTGIGANNIPYSFKINSSNPLTRDFSCYPEPVGGVTETTPQLKTWKKEFHPFKKGWVTLITGDKYPRQIYFGNEGDNGLELQCDNSGEVLIKGISYKIDFEK